MVADAATDAPAPAALVVVFVLLLFKYAVERTLKSSPSWFFASLFILLSLAEGVSCILFYIIIYINILLLFNSRVLLSFIIFCKFWIFGYFLFFFFSLIGLERRV